MQQKSVRARAGSTRVYCTPVILPRSVKWTQVVSSWQNTMDHIGSAQQGGIPWHRTKQLNGKLIIISSSLSEYMEIMHLLYSPIPATCVQAYSYFWSFLTSNYAFSHPGCNASIFQQLGAITHSEQVKLGTLTNRTNISTGPNERGGRT